MVIRTEPFRFTDPVDFPGRSKQVLCLFARVGLHEFHC